MTEHIELEWIERDLRALDTASGEILVGALYADVRPPGGVVALLDWRMCGRISQRCIGGFLSGARGERFLLPGRPRIAFDKVLLVGMGARTTCPPGDEGAVTETLTTMIDALAGLQARRAAIELPGRNGVPAARALELLDAVLNTCPSSLESVTVIDDRDMHRAVEAFRVRPGRRTRGAQR